ncbi:MAG: ATP synthase subunit I [Anaeroplasmataceae bacterium]
MRNDEMTKLSIIVVPVSWVVGALIALIIYLSCSDADKTIWLKSYILGLVTALLNFGLQVSGGRGFIREVNRTDGAPVRRSILGYVLRLLIAGLIFGFIVYDMYSDSPRFHIIPALIGYVTVKMVLIVVSLIINIRKGKVST